MLVTMKACCLPCQNHIKLVCTIIQDIFPDLINVHAEFVPRLIQSGVDKLFEVTRDKDQDLLIKVLVALQAREALPSGSLLTGISKFTNQLEDLRLVSCCCTTARLCVCSHQQLMPNMHIFHLKYSCSWSLACVLLPGICISSNTDVPTCNLLCATQTSVCQDVHCRTTFGRQRLALHCFMHVAF